MSGADDDSDPRGHEDELDDAITLLDDLVKELEARVGTSFDDDIQGGTRIFLTNIVLPAMQKALETCMGGTFVGYAREYIGARQQAAELGQPDTVLRT